MRCALVRDMQYKIYGVARCKATVANGVILFHPQQRPKEKRNGMMPLPLPPLKWSLLPAAQISCLRTSSLWANNNKISATASLF